MQLDDFIFSKLHLMKYVDSTFEQFFGETIKLLEQQHSEKAGGYFSLIYNYLPKDYEVFFEHECLMFSIRITRKDGSFTSVNHIYKGQINNTLSEANIYEAIRLLANALVNEKIIFYKIKKNKQVEVKE